jgi:hypothetical protein
MANGNKKCAVCRAPIKTSELRPSIPIRRIVADMDTTCSNADCKWKGTRGNLQDHELTCGYATVACEYGHDKCGTCRRMDLKKHHVSECLYFICKCTLGCGQSLTRRDLSKHKKVCPNARAKCERCSQQVRRKEIPHHTEHVCPKSKIYCFAGCKGKMLREQLGGHILSNLGPHLCALATNTRMAEQENKRLAARLAEQDKSLAALAETVAELKAARAAAPAEEDEDESSDDEEEEEGAGGDDEEEESSDDEEEEGAGVDDDGESSDDVDEEEEEVEEGDGEESDGDDDVDADGSGAGASGSPGTSSSGSDGEGGDEDSDEDDEDEDEEGGTRSHESSDDSDSSQDDSDSVMYRLADSPVEDTDGGDSA